jgi:hypothetical protein
MIEYEQVKNIVKNNFDLSKHKNITEKDLILLKIIQSNYDLFYDSFFTYKLNSYSFYRFYYIFYVLIKYIHKLNNQTSENIKPIFELFVKYTRKYKYHIQNEKKINYISNKLLSQYQYLYNIFFIEQNAYYLTYFNNLTKYCFPLPFDINTYFPIITYRKSIHNKNRKSYKQNWIDYYDTIKKHDVKNHERLIMTGKRNIDMIQREFDTVVDINHLSSFQYDETNYRFIIKLADIMYICKSMKENNHEFIFDVIYSRKNNFNPSLLKTNNSFEEINPLWEVNNITITIKRNKILYLSIMKLLTEQDLFNVFNPISFDKDFFYEFYHYTGLDINSHSKLQLNNLLECPTFFSPTPIYYSKKAKYYKNKKCIFFNVNHDINNLINLTENITINNPFNKHTDKVKHTFFSFNKMNQYYDNEHNINNNNDLILNIDLQDDPKYKCFDIDYRKNLKDYLDDKKHVCDVGNSKMYVGRRKLQEILYKTRKYMSRDIWQEQHENIDRFLKKLNKKRERIISHDIYHPNKKSCIMYSYNYDAILLEYIGCNGYFFTDYVDRIYTGGEILLTHPNKYLEIKEYSLDKCHNINLTRKKFE